MNAPLPCPVVADLQRHLHHEAGQASYARRLARRVEDLLDEQMATSAGWDRFGQQAGAAEWAALDGLLAQLCRAACEDSRIEAQRDLSALFTRCLAPTLRGEAEASMRLEDALAGPDDDALPGWARPFH